MTRITSQVEPPPAPSLQTKPLRADAARNRALILDAARVLFAERGLDVSLDDVARRAGVGVGTLYRRFADRDELIEAIFEERIQAELVRLREAIETPDAWEGLVAFLRRTCGELATDRGMRQFFLGAARGQACMTRGRELLYPLTAQLVDRVKAQGAVTDATFAPTDVPVLLLMMFAVGDFAGDIEPDLWQRYFEIYLAGIRARSDQAAPDSPPLQPEQLEQATSAWRPGYR